jgi:hypothetical protein
VSLLLVMYGRRFFCYGTCSRLLVSKGADYFEEYIVVMQGSEIFRIACCCCNTGQINLTNLIRS